jgi:hypothetical protein
VAGVGQSPQQFFPSGEKNDADQIMSGAFLLVFPLGKLSFEVSADRTVTGKFWSICDVEPGH